MVVVADNTQAKKAKISQSIKGIFREGSDSLR